MPKNQSLSVIIPTYNESSIITQTLSTILTDGLLNNCEIIIVCNGCHDDSAAISYQFIANNTIELHEKNCKVHIIETQMASKTHAINLGIAQSSNSGIILLDADIIISGLALLTLYKEMILNRAFIASPRLIYNYKKSDFWVRHYYQVASRSNYNRFSRISNVIALSNQAIQRITPMPSVIADDDFIRRQFDDAEKLVTDKCHFEFICPRDLTSLLKTLTRIKVGNIQLTQFSGTDISNKDKQWSLFSKDTIKQVSLFSLMIFTLIKLITLCRAKWQLHTGQVPLWERDESNRH